LIDKTRPLSKSHTGLVNRLWLVCEDL